MTTMTRHHRKNRATETEIHHQQNPMNRVTEAEAHHLHRTWKSPATTMKHHRPMKTKMKMIRAATAEHHRLRESLHRQVKENPRKSLRRQAKKKAPENLRHREK
jgi:hypothetical protein